MHRITPPDRRRWSCLHEGHEERMAAHAERIQAELKRLKRIKRRKKAA